jgi:hypothetical protein
MHIIHTSNNSDVEMEQPTSSCGSANKNFIIGDRRLKKEPGVKTDKYRGVKTA